MGLGREPRNAPADRFAVRVPDENGERITFEIESNHDVLPYDFEISRGIVLPAGAYDFTKTRLEFSTSARRSVAVSIHYNFGPFYSGRYNDFNAGLTVKVDRFVNLSFSTNLVRGFLAQGDFSQNVYEVKADFFSPPTSA